MSDPHGPGSRTPVSSEHTDLWTQFALRIRTVEHVVAKVAHPDKGTPFARADGMYPEAISQWAREGLRSALDHLGIWADFAVPIEQFEGQTIKHVGFRWPFTLMRAALEGASQSLWLTGSPTVHVAIANLVRMVRHDLREQRLAFEAIGRDTSAIVAREARHEAVAAKLVDHGPDTEKLPSMVDLVKQAATATGQDPGKFAYYYRACSGATHGKDWASKELQMPTSGTTEWMPGQFAYTAVMNPAKQTEILGETIRLVEVSASRFLERTYSGDIVRLTAQATFDAQKVMPLVPGGEATLEAFRLKWGLDV